MKMNKTKIFISAFSCMPHMGSEPGVGWHWIVEMSKYYELWVLVHKEPIDDIETYVKEMDFDKKIHFIYYDIPFNTFFFKNGKFRWVRTYYQIWTALSNKIIQKTMIENDIHIFHHLTFGNAIWPVSKFGQKQNFIWGPIGGVETIPKEYIRFYNVKSQIIERIRRIVVKSLCLNWGFNNRCKHAGLILCKTEAMLKSVPKPYRNKAILFTDVAVDCSRSEKLDIEKEPSDVIELLSVGRLDAWRGFDILIEAFEKAKKLCPQIHLTILGNGMDWNRLQYLIRGKNLQQDCSMLGEVPVEHYNRIMIQADMVVNSCLKEGAVTVSFDSMRYGKPLICVDTGGFTRCFSNSYAIVLSQQSRESLIQSMCNAIVKLAVNEDLRKEMGRKARQAGSQFVWQEKGKQIQKTINNYILKSCE